jgi:hypothetical protein
MRDNIARCAAQGVTKVFRRDATRLGELRGAPFSLVFLDPPYGKGLGERALAAAGAGGWLAPGATIVWEEDTSISGGFAWRRAGEDRFHEAWAFSAFSTAVRSASAPRVSAGSWPSPAQARADGFGPDPWR